MSLSSKKRSRLLLTLLKKRGILKEELNELEHDLPKDEFKEEEKEETEDKATGISSEKESEEAPSKEDSPGEGGRPSSKEQPFT